MIWHLMNSFPLLFIVPWCTVSLSVHGIDGSQVTKTTGLNILLQESFDLKINNLKYRVQVPEEGTYEIIIIMIISHLIQCICVVLKLMI